MKVEFYDSKRRKKIIEELNSNFGITELPKVIFATGRDKMRGFSGDLTIDEIYSLDRLANVEFIGIYLFKEDLGHLRLGFDGAILLGKQIIKNIVEIDEKQLEKWMTGHSLEIPLERGMYAVRHNGDIFGCGLSDGKILINFVPKERRIRRSS